MIYPQEDYIDPKDGKNEKKEIITSFQYRLVGPYLCYRHYSDDCIRIRKVLNDDGKHEEMPGLER